MAVFRKNAVRLAAGHTAVDPVVHYHYRRQGAGADAGHRLQGVLAVGGGLPRLDTQMPLRIMENAGAPLNMAGGTAAYPDRAAAAGYKPELGVEGADGVHGAVGQVQVVGYLLYGLCGEVAILLLDFLEDGYEAVPTLAVSRQNTGCLCLANGRQVSPSPASAIPQ